MTREELINSDKDILRPIDIAEVMDADPQTIRTQAATDPRGFPFPVCRCGNRTKIPRIPFLRSMGYID